MCIHQNPAGYRFCATCGEALATKRCHCGFVARGDDLFCGQCGRDLSGESDAEPGVAASTASGVDYRFDLDEIIANLNAQAWDLGSSVTHVSQDDIEALFNANDGNES